MQKVSCSSCCILVMEYVILTFYKFNRLLSLLHSSWSHSIPLSGEFMSEHSIISDCSKRHLWKKQLQLKKPLTNTFPSRHRATRSISKSTHINKAKTFSVTLELTYTGIQAKKHVSKSIFHWCTINVGNCVWCVLCVCVCKRFASECSKLCLLLSSHWLSIWRWRVKFDINCRLLGTNDSHKT